MFLCKIRGGKFHNDLCFSYFRSANTYPSCSTASPTSSSERTLMANPPRLPWECSVMRTSTSPLTKTVTAMVRWVHLCQPVSYTLHFPNGPGPFPYLLSKCTVSNCCVYVLVILYVCTLCSFFSYCLGIST